jgi:hypothetical protein
LSALRRLEPAAGTLPSLQCGEEFPTKRVTFRIGAQSSNTPQLFRVTEHCHKGMQRLSPPDWWSKTVEHLAEWFSDR